ncbi:hypothetical protein AAG906_029661 [Vitis piasezkii]
MANQERIECMGQCPGLMLTIQGIPVMTDYYILPVAACQVVLGVQWLETLGPIESDYKALTMSFKLGGAKHTLHGVRRTVGIFNIEALDDREFPFTSTIARNGRAAEPICSVFEKPNNLPPKRPHDHRIPLQPTPISRCETIPISILPKAK